MNTEQKQAILDKIGEIVGEQVSSYVFVANVEEDEPGHDSCTISSWDGGINMALGLVKRMEIRLETKARKLEGPDDDDE